jgi:archaeal flagellar protein FlaF
MAVAEIIGAAIGVLLLVVVAYMLVGGTLTAAETVMTAQKDITLLQEARLSTDIEISDKEIQGNYLNFTVTNIGDETVGDLPHMDVFSYSASNQYTRYVYDSTGSGAEGTWSVISFEKDVIHKHQLDPGVRMRIKAVFPAGATPETVQVTTGNGISVISNI